MVLWRHLLKSKKTKEEALVKWVQSLDREQIAAFESLPLRRDMLTLDNSKGYELNPLGYIRLTVNGKGLLDLMK